MNKPQPLNETDENLAIATHGTHHPPIYSEKTDSGAPDPAFLVRFELHDPDDPKNFSSFRKSWSTFVMSLMALAGTVGSSIVAPAEPEIAKDLELGEETTVLMIALFILGS